MKVTTIDLDLAKNVFQAHRVDEDSAWRRARRRTTGRASW